MDFRNPFGIAACEDEVKTLGSKYHSWFFSEVPFSKESLNTDVYLIRGRRGSGKTALTQYFGFQNRMPATALTLPEGKLSREFLLELTHWRADPRAESIDNLRKAWELIVWSILFINYKHVNTDLLRASNTVCAGDDRVEDIAGFIL